MAAALESERDADLRDPLGSPVMAVSDARGPLSFLSVPSWAPRSRTQGWKPREGRGRGAGAGGEGRGRVGKGREAKEQLAGVGRKYNRSQLRLQSRKPSGEKGGSEGGAKELMPPAQCSVPPLFVESVGASPTAIGSPPSAQCGAVD